MSTEWIPATRLCAVLHLYRYTIILFILQKMSIQAVSDSLLLSSFCSFQERGQRLWWGRMKTSAFLGSWWHRWPSFSFRAIPRCIFHKNYSSRSCWPDVVRTALQLIYFFWCESRCNSVHMVCNIFMCGARWFSLSSQRRPSGSVAITGLLWPAEWDTTNQILCVLVHPGLQGLVSQLSHDRLATLCSPSWSKNCQMWNSNFPYS